MTLQTRLILVVMSTLLLVAVALIGLGWMAQNSVEERFRHATISRQDVLWREIVSGQLELMTASTSGLTRNEGALHALASGQLALGMLRTAAMRDEPYDLALLDMQMPGMDGLELARTIKADPALATLPLVMLTSITYLGHEELAQQAGIAAYLTKPVRQSHLFDCLTLVKGTAARAVGASSRITQPLIDRYRLAHVKAQNQPRILVAEDNLINQKVAVRLLEKLGYKADVAANGNEVVEALTRTPYAAVLMDCQMPHMDGFEATVAIRQREGSTRHTPIIAMTAGAMQGDREKVLAAGMDDYLSKPVKPDDLASMLRRWIPHETA